MSEWYAKTQGETLVTADHHRERWTTEDLEFVAAFTDDVTDAELATTVGRSLASLWAIQNRLRNEGVEGVLESYARAGRARATEVGYDFITTFPPGWDD